MDEAHKQTDIEIERLKRRIEQVYSQARKEMQDKMDDFIRRFKVKDNIHRKELENGEITKEQYQSWLRGQVFQGKRWKAKLDQLATTATNADMVAQKLINGQLNGVFYNNANWQAYSLEHGVGVNFGFDMYDSSTVSILLKDQPELLPKYDINIPEDYRWNQKLITDKITQGIIQGEGIVKVAKRLEEVTDRNKSMCITRARTAMTAAQNAGRQKRLSEAENLGIRLKKEWISTLDGHTRTTHRILDGQKVDIDAYFQADGYKIRYPGDPQATPQMVMGCRCTMDGLVLDYPELYKAERYDNIDGVKIKDMTYREWERVKLLGKRK